MRYTRNSVRRALGQGSNSVNLAARARRANAEATNLRAALSTVAEITSRGTSPNGTTRKIASIVGAALAE